MNINEKVLSKDLFFETRFYTINDVSSGNCEDSIFKLVKKFSNSILDDIVNVGEDYSEDLAFRLTFEGYCMEDFAEVTLGLYAISSDINEGLFAEYLHEYKSMRISLGELQLVLENITLPKVSSVTKPHSGLVEKEDVWTERDQVIDYEKIYYPKECECNTNWSHECDCAEPWEYDYDRPYVSMVNREFSKKYWSFDLCDKDEEEYF